MERKGQHFMSRPKRRSKRTGRLRRILALLLCTAVLLFAGQVLPALGSAVQTPVFCPGETACGQRRPAFGQPGSPLPEDYTVELTTLSNGQQVASRIYPDLQAMFDQARAEGLALFVREGYRTAQQQRLMEEKIRAYEAEGLFPQKPKQVAAEWVALWAPASTSWALRWISTPTPLTAAGEQVYAWLEKHAHLYGFILRYPPTKVDLTGFSYEPWHFRMWAARLPPRSMRRGCAWKNTFWSGLRPSFGAAPCRLAQGAGRFS